MGADSDNRVRDLMWSPGAPIWITSGTSFVAFAKKTDHDNLLSVLREALYMIGLRGHPGLCSRRFGQPLMSTACQHRGLPYATVTPWRTGITAYLRPIARRIVAWRIAETVSRHAGKLVKEILPSVEEFVSALIRCGTRGRRRHHDVQGSLRCGSR